MKDNKFGPNRVIKNCQLQVYTAVHLTASGNVMEATGARSARFATTPDARRPAVAETQQWPIPDRDGPLAIYYDCPLIVPRAAWTATLGLAVTCLGGEYVSRIVGYAPGAYDLFHVGHVNLLRHARSHCDYLVAGVVSDEKCERTKGVRPFVPLLERAEIVRSIGFVDEVYEEHVATKLEAWQDVRFDRIFKGDDWRGTAEGPQARTGVRFSRCRGRLLSLHSAHVEQHAPQSAELLVRRRARQQLLNRDRRGSLRNHVGWRLHRRSTGRGAAAGSPADGKDGIVTCLAENHGQLRERQPDR